MHIGEGMKTQTTTRIYALVFQKQRAGRVFDFIGRSQKRDHRKLGQELELFMFFLKKLVPVCLFGYPKGTALCQRLKIF